jgi:hypothetical protein
MSTGAETGHRSSETVGHELRDVSFRPIVAAAAGLIVVVGLVLLGMWALVGSLAAREARLSPAANPLAASARALPPQPRLQAAPIDDLRQLREAEDRILTTYGWTNVKEGLVRIPIEQAMDLLAARGIHPDSEERP